MRSRPFSRSASTNSTLARPAAPTAWAFASPSRTAGRIVAGAAGFSWAGFAQVRELWVDEAYRGQGLGAELMAAAEREAVRRGCAQLQVSTYSFQAPEFYRRLGFEEVARVPGHRDGYDSVHLVKQLQRDHLA